MRISPARFPTCPGSRSRRDRPKQPRPPAHNGKKSSLPEGRFVLPRLDPENAYWTQTTPPRNQYGLRLASGQGGQFWCFLTVRRSAGASTLTLPHSAIVLVERGETNVNLTEPDSKPDRLRKRVNLALVCVFLLFAILWGVLLAYRFSQTIEAGEHRADNLALILSDHLRRSVEAIDAALTQIAVTSPRLGGPKAAQAWTPLLEATRAGILGVSSITITDETGTVTASTIPELVGQPRRDMYVFQQLSKSPDSGLVADTPFKSQRSNRLLLPFGRPLASAEGAFAGMVVAVLEPERLREFYRSVDVGPKGMITVLHPAGIVLFQEPSSQDLIGQPAQNHPIFVAQRERPGAGMLRGPLAPGGPSYLSAYRSVPFPPLVVAVSLAEDDVLASWRSVTLLALGLTFALGIALLLAASLIKREIRDRTAATARLVETDAALRASRQRLQALMDHAPLLIAEKDLKGRFTFVNRAFQERLGMAGEDVVGRTGHELFAADRAETQASLDREVIETKSSVLRELTVPSPSGPRTMLFTKFPLIDATGAMEAIGTIGTDVTDLKHAEVQLAHAQKMEAIGQLTGGVAHDFNNLLTAILLNSDVLADRITDERLRPLAEATRAAAERGADLTKRLLAFGRRQTLEPRPTDVNGLIADMEQMMRRTLGEHIAIEIRTVDDVWPAKIDAGQLESAVVNLAVNARDAMPHGGRITIETANVEVDGSYAMSADARPGEYVMIAVSDTGTGMPQEVLARAFEPFFTTKDVGKGTGLGLSMVYGFVKQSGGHARIYSEPGMGTVVRLYLPRSDVPAEMAATRQRSTSELPTGGETILFVEDDPLVRKHTEGQLVALGYQVIVAENADKALACVDNGTMPDLLFTDIVMPGSMNGRELADRLRGRWPMLKVLYTSGFSHGMLDPALDSQSVAKHLLGKPFRRRDLAAKVREVLDETEAA
jgi:PAS domain S-box-containing protein